MLSTVLTFKALDPKPAVRPHLVHAGRWAVNPSRSQPSAACLPSYPHSKPVQNLSVPYSFRSQVSDSNTTVSWRSIASPRGFRDFSLPGIFAPEAKVPGNFRSWDQRFPLGQLSLRGAKIPGSEKSRYHPRV